MKIIMLSVLFVLASYSVSIAYDLEWIENATNETGVRIYRKLPTEPVFSQLVELPSNVTKYSDPTRIVGTCYEVALFNAFGESGRAGACAMGPDGAISLIIIR